jgi:hypothetical protein
MGFNLVSQVFPRGNLLHVLVIVAVCNLLFCVYLPSKFYNCRVSLAVIYWCIFLIYHYRVWFIIGFDLSFQVLIIASFELLQCLIITAGFNLLLCVCNLQLQVKFVIKRFQFTVTGFNLLLGLIYYYWVLFIIAITGFQVTVASFVCHFKFQVLNLLLHVFNGKL